MNNLDEIIEGLQTPTPPYGIGFIPRSLNESTREPGTYGALAVPYVEHAWVRELLDRICTPFGWQLDTKEVADLLCVGIGILNPETNEWIWKWDTGHDIPFVPGKTTIKMTASGRGIFSLSFKRAAYNWGIGSDIRNLKPKWVPCTAFLSKKDNEMKFKDWLKDPLPIVMGRQPEPEPLQPAGTATTTPRLPDPQTGELLSPQASAAGDPKKMYNKCISYAKTMCNMTVEEAEKFIQPYLDEHGKNDAAYQLAWNGLVDYRRGRHPSQQ